MLALTTVFVKTFAEEMSPEEVIKARQANLRDMGGAFKGINDELKKSQPQLPLIRQFVEQIDDLARQQSFWFPAGSGPEAEIKTAAKVDIWKRPQEFRQATEQLMHEATAMLKVASGTDVDAIRAQTKALGAACSGCHKVFREKEE